MVIARRLYVYFIAGISLAMTGIGLMNLLSLALSRIAEALGGSVMRESPDEIRRQLSLYAAFVIVAFPVWLLHWWMAERAVHRPAPEGEHERASAIRAVYLTLAMALPLMFLITGSAVVLSSLLRKLFDTSYSIGTGNEIWTPLAFSLVAGASVAYHSWIRHRDVQGGALEDAAVWLPRAYVYVAAFTGAMLMLFGIRDLILVLNDALFGTRAFSYVSRWWAEPLSNAIARTVVGLVIWATYWEWSLRTVRRADWLGISERRSALRWFYVYAIVFVGILLSLNGVVSSLEALFRLILNAPRREAGVGSARAIIEPLLWAVPFAVFWAYHRLIVLNAAPADELAPAAPALRRLYLYLVSFVGLVFTAVGAAWVLGIMIDLLLGGSRTVSISSTFWRDDIARFSAFAIVGAGAWLWHWNEIERQVAQNDAVERSALTRRAYLYLTLAATLVAMLVSLAIVIYRVISVILGVSAGGSLASAISAALGIVVIAGALFAYHVTVLRGDLAEREAPETAPSAVRVPLTLIGPPDADVVAALTELRAHLPAGYSLETSKAWQPKEELAADSRRLERDHA